MKKRFMKRGLSLLLAIAMMFGMIQTPYMTQEVKAADAEISSDGMTVTASGTSETNNGEGVSPTNDEIKTIIFDDNNTTFWRSNSLANGASTTSVAKGNPYLTIDLGGTYNLSQVDYTPRWDSNAHWECTGNISTLIVEVSEDGSSWTDVTNGGQTLDLSQTSSSAFPATVTFAAENVQHVRISGTASYHWDVNGNNNSGVSQENTSITIADLAIYGTEVTESGGTDSGETDTDTNLVYTNVAYQKTITASLNSGQSGTLQTGSNGGDRPLSMAVDGVLGNTSSSSCANYADIAIKSGSSEILGSAYIQVDLEGVYDIDKLNLYRYWVDGRTYNATVIVLAENESDFGTSAQTIVYNTDTNNVHGLGTGSDTTYAETTSGKEFVLDEAVSTRYIRVYMYGSSEGNTNHIVELQAWAYEQPEVPAFEHDADYLDIPTFDATGKVDGVVHPDIIDMSEFIGVVDSVDADGKWHGYRYYMAVTPNQNGNSQFENPCLVASNDGLTWEVPAGIDNPLTGVDEEPTPLHNCDPDLVYNDQTDSIYLYYVWANDGYAYGTSGFEPMQVRKFEIVYDDSTSQFNTLNQGNPDTVITTTYRYDLLSPSVLKTGENEWKMWSVNTGDTGWNNQTNFVEYRTSTDGINWSSPTSLASSFDQDGYVFWHIDVHLIGDEYWAVYPAYPDGGGSNYTELFFAKSSDGINWTTYDEPIMVPDSASWDCDFIYRSTFLYDEDTDLFRLWYSAGANDTDGWRIGYTENTYTNMMAALGEDVGTTDPDPDPDPDPTPDPAPSETVDPDDVSGTWNNIINDSEMTYSGTWTSDSSSSFYNSDAHYSNDPDSSVTFTFTGTAFRWYGQTEANFKYGKIYVDGVYVGIANSYGTAETQQLIAEVSGLSSGEHTVLIVPYGPADAHWNTIDVDYADYSTTAGYADVTATSIVATTEYNDMSSVSLIVGNSTEINAFAKNGDVYVAENIEYTVADTSVATVTKAADGTFTITGVTAGTTTLTLTADGATKVVTITVNEPGAKRLTISNEEPLLIVPVYGQSYSASGSELQWGDTLLGRWNSIPEDIRDNVVMEVHCMRASGNVSEFYTQQLEIAQANNIPVMLVTANGGTVQFSDDTWLANAMENYSCLKGFIITENYWVSGSETTIATAAASHLKVASDYGGYLIWYEHKTGYIESVLNVTAFKDALAQYGDSFAFTWKNTPIEQNAATASYMQGLWLEGVIDQWGGLMDSWKWWELGYAELFNPTTSLTGGGNGRGHIGQNADGDGEETRACVMEPEAVLGMEMLSIYANGGTIYSFEHPAYTQGVNDGITPAFTNVIYETFKYIMDNAGPTKEEILEETEVFIHGNLSSNPEIFTGVTMKDQRIPTYLTGQYGLIPSVPASITVDDVDSSKVVSFSSVSTASALQSYLNGKYTDNAYTGDAFAQKVAETWILYNSIYNESNTNQNATVSVSGQSVDVDMTPHTFTIMEKENNTISVLLNNYRVDKDSIWDGYSYSTLKWDPDVNELMQNWIEQSYCVNTNDGTYRSTVYTLTGLSEKPTVTVVRAMADSYNTPVVAFNESTGTATITITNNGYMEFTIALTDEVIPTETELDDIVIDFGLPVTVNYEAVATTITGGTTTSGNPVAVSGDSASGAWSVTYTPNLVLQEVDEVTLTDASGNTYTFKVYPATSVYYEARFANYVSEDTNDPWYISISNEKQTASVVGSGDHYGYDDAYKASASASAASSVIGDQATFTFTGTGIDVYMNCAADTGKALVQITVTNQNGTLEKMVVTDTKLAVESGSVDETQGLGNVSTAHNVPVVSLDLDYGVHCVTINHIRYTGEADSELIIDGFRVYGTLESDTDGVYTADGESDPSYVRMRDQLIDSLRADDFVYDEDSEYAEQIAAGLAQNIIGTADTANGVVIVSGSAAGYTADDLQDFIDNSSKNELLLYPQQSLLFSVSNTSNLQLGLRALEGNVEYSLNGGTAQTMRSNVDMFYKVEAVDGDNDGTYTVTITNTTAAPTDGSSPAILAITKLKAFTPQVKFAPLTTYDLTEALLSLGYESEPEDKDDTDQPIVSENAEVVRLYGEDRNYTSYMVADALKEELGITQFNTVIVATGKDFADALSGSYLAVKKNAPILLTNSKADNVEDLCDYINKNLTEDGMVYILGGELAVSTDAQAALEADHTVVRLCGDSRYETSVAILNEADVEEGTDLIVATGKDFADSLSVSALKKPILLVKPNAALTDAQKELAAKAGQIYIVGGTDAVTEATEAELDEIGTVERIAGSGRQETSKLVAERFFGDVDAVVLAKAMDYPDGLCGGPLAAAMNVPLLLTRDNKSEIAEGYVQGLGIESGIVLGGDEALADQTVMDVFALESADEIILK